MTILPPLPGPVDAVLSFTAHHVIAAAVDAEEIRSRLVPGDLVAPMRGEFLAWMAARLGTTCGALDAVLVMGNSGGEPEMELRPIEAASHARIQRALRYRREVRAFTDTEGRGVLVIGRGLAGRWEIAFEVDPGHRGRGLGRAFAAAAASLVPDGDPVFAQVTPGNAASVRALLAAGFRPIGAEVLFRRTGS